MGVVIGLLFCRGDVGLKEAMVDGVISCTLTKTSSFGISPVASVNPSYELE